MSEPALQTLMVMWLVALAVLALLLVMALSGRNRQ